MGDGRHVRSNDKRRLQIGVLKAHCNPNGLEKLGYLSTNDSGNDDRSKCTIDVIFSFLMNLKWGWSVIKCDVLLKHNSKQKQESET